MGSKSLWTLALLKSLSDLPLLSAGLQVHPPPVRARKGQNPLGVQGKMWFSWTCLNVKTSQGWKAQSLSSPNPGTQLAGSFLASVLPRVSKHLIFHPSHCCRAVHSNNSNASCWKRGGSVSNFQTLLCPKYYHSQSTEKNQSFALTSLTWSNFSPPLTWCNSISSVTHDHQWDGMTMQWCTKGYTMGKPSSRSQWLWYPNLYWLL